MTPQAMIEWLRTHSARVRFESDGQVSVTVSCYKRRRPTLGEAIEALQQKLDPAALLAKGLAICTPQRA